MTKKNQYNVERKMGPNIIGGSVILKGKSYTENAMINEIIIWIAWSGPFVTYERNFKFSKTALWEDHHMYFELQCISFYLCQSTNSWVCGNSQNAKKQYMSERKMGRPSFC